MKKITEDKELIKIRYININGINAVSTINIEEEWHEHDPEIIGITENHFMNRSRLEGIYNRLEAKKKKKKKVCVGGEVKSCNKDLFIYLLIFL